MLIGLFKNRKLQNLHQIRGMPIFGSQQSRLDLIENGVASVTQAILPPPETPLRISGTTPGCEIGEKMR